MGHRHAEMGLPLLRMEAHALVRGLALAAVRSVSLMRWLAVRLAWFRASSP